MMAKRPLTVTLLCSSLLVVTNAFTPPHQGWVGTAVPAATTLLRESDMDDDFSAYDDGFDDDFYESPRRSRRKRTRVAIEDDEDDDDDDDDDDFESKMEGLIPNPLLDNIDPEGTFSRMDELLTNKKFWVDICIMLFLLNVLDNIIMYDESPYDYLVGMYGYN